MTPPPDTEQVLAALRLGWGISELRGRLRIGRANGSSGMRTDHALPLADERTWAEQTIETKEVFATLAKTLELDDPQKDLQRYSNALQSARDAGDQNAVRLRWGDLCEFLYKWDAGTQERWRPSRSPSQADTNSAADLQRSTGR